MIRLKIICQSGKVQYFTTTKRLSAVACFPFHHHRSSISAQTTETRQGSGLGYISPDLSNTCHSTPCTSSLTNRLARVKMNGKIGRCHTYKESLPSSSVLPPLLFIIFINDLLSSFEQSKLVTAYADELALACSGRNKDGVEGRLQPNIDKAT